MAMGFEVFYCDEWVGLSEDSHVQENIIWFESSAKDGAVGSLLQLWTKMRQSGEAGKL